MKLFICACEHGNRLFFESVQCTACSRMVGYCPDIGSMQAFEPVAERDGVWRSVGTGTLYRQCANYSEYQVCNWMLEDSETDETLCRACRLNFVIPDLSQPDNLDYWRRIEAAKRHALYSVLELGLPLASRRVDADRGLQFRFMTDREPVSEFTEPLGGQPPVMTGHNNGEITINLAEADDVARTRIRVKLGEAYRTLLGHFRHEIGHYYWYRLVENDANLLAQFRALFGDETQDYDAALQQHYANGAAPDWFERFISPYASMHPWEDWAECWAHYLHMIDTLETAQSLQLNLDGAPVPAVPLPAEALTGELPDEAESLQLAGSDPQSDAAPDTAAILLADWMRLSVGLNALNRSMGMPDPYPFVLTEAVREKLSWVHRVIMRREYAIEAQLTDLAAPAADAAEPSTDTMAQNADQPAA
jgi:hypothetical protein